MTNRYLVIYAKGVGETGFTGFSPDVPGCYSEGETLPAMRAMLTEALTFHIEGTMEDGDTLPTPHTTQVDFKEEDFEGVEYFIVEHLAIEIPLSINPVQGAHRSMAIPA